MNGEDTRSNVIIILLIVMIISNAFLLRLILNFSQPVINVPLETPLTQVECKSSPYILSSSGENLWLMNTETGIIKLFKITGSNYGAEVIQEVTSYQVSK